MLNNVYIIGLACFILGVLTGLIVWYWNSLYRHNSKREKMLMKVMNKLPDEYAKYMKEVEERNKEKLKFFKSPDFQKLYEKIFNEVQRKGTIDNEHLGYCEQEFSITYAEFIDFATIIDLAIKEREEDSSATWDNDIKRYKELTIYWMHGQGTAIQIYETKKGRWQ